MIEVRFRDNTSYNESCHRVIVNENGYDKLMQADAAGIIDIIYEESGIEQ